MVEFSSPFCQIHAVQQQREALASNPTQYYMPLQWVRSMIHQVTQTNQVFHQWVNNAMRAAQPADASQHHTGPNGAAQAGPSNPQIRPPAPPPRSTTYCPTCTHPCRRVASRPCRTHTCRVWSVPTRCDDAFDLEEADAKTPGRGRFRLYPVACQPTADTQVPEEQAEVESTTEASKGGGEGHCVQS